MNTLRIPVIAAPHSDAHRQFGQALRAFHTRFIEIRRQRRAERRMLLAVQDLDHPGVLADIAACSKDRART